MDHKSEECPGQHGDDTGADHGKVRHVEPPEDETDHKNYNIVDTEECLDRCQVFLFIFGGGKQVERRSGTARREQAVTDAADDCGRNQEREHDSPLNGISVFEGNIECADRHHDDGQPHGLTVFHDQRSANRRAVN